jgi:hypothetical protein
MSPLQKRAQPCESPRRVPMSEILGPLPPGRETIWFPLDCGRCGPCRSRARIAAEHRESGRVR